MISSVTSNSATTLLLEKENVDLPPRILELREKIHSEEYLNNAILRIATVISGKLVENSEELKFSD